MRTQADDPGHARVRSRRAKEALRDSASDVLPSFVSAWEIAVKHSVARLPLLTGQKTGGPSNAVPTGSNRHHSTRPPR